MVIPRPSNQHFFLADLRSVSDCLLRPVGCDSDFGYHGESQIYQLTDTFCVTAGHLGTGRVKPVRESGDSHQLPIGSFSFSHAIVPPWIRFISSPVKRH